MCPVMWDSLASLRYVKNIYGEMLDTLKAAKPLPTLFLKAAFLHGFFDALQ